MGTHGIERIYDATRSLHLLLSRRIARRSNVLLLRRWLCGIPLAKDAGIPSILDLRRDARSLRQATEFVQLRLHEALPAENVGLEPPRQVLGSLIPHVRASGDGEDIVEFFKGSLLGLWQPQEATLLSVISLYDFDQKLTS